MKIVCHREALLNGVSIAANVTPSRSPKPILTGVLLSATKEEVVALATDLEVAICSRIAEVIVDRPGEIVLTAQTLVEILRSIEGHEVTIDCEGRYCEITSEDAQYKLVVHDVEEFPEIQLGQTEGTPVPRGFLEEMFARTAFAAAKDIGRYAINGVLVEIGAGQIRFVATDGRRLSIATRDLPDANFDVRRAIIPPKGIQESLRSSEGSSTVRVLVEENRVVFASERADVTTKPVEGEYPDYNAVIPSEHTGKAIVERSSILAAMRKVSVMAGEDMRQVKLSVKDGEISISSQVEGHGEAKTRIEAETTGEVSLVVDYNPDYIIDFLKALPSSQNVSFEYRDAGKASIFRLEGTEDRYVVMPITTS